jgi:hypothetical protein
MTTTKTLLERVQSLPIHLIREIKNRLDPETQIDLLKNKPSVYVNVNKTIRTQYVKMYLKEPSMRALRRGLKKETCNITHKIRDSMGESKYQTYCVNCELPGHVVAKMYDSAIYKPMMKALKKAEADAPIVFDLDGKMKPCISPLEKSLVTRFKILAPPVKPTYTNERTKSRYARALGDYYNSISRRVYELLNDFDQCASFISELDYEIRMSSLRFLKALSIFSKKYLPSEVDQLLSKRTPEDIEIDKNRKAYYTRNQEKQREEQEERNMRKEYFYTLNLMREEAKIREQHAKEQRKLAREEAKTRKLQEKENRQRLKEERATKKAEQDQEKALRAVFREQARAKKIAEKKQKDAEMIEKYTFKMIRTMFV